MLREPTIASDGRLPRSGKKQWSNCRGAAPCRPTFFSLRCFRQTTLCKGPWRDESSDHGGNSGCHTHTHTRELYLPRRQTDVKPLQSPLPADRLSSSEARKVVKPTATACNFSSSRPDRAADRCANAAVCRRLRRGSQSQPSRVGSRGGPPLFNSSIDRQSGTRPETIES
jgi:hypothetical protein